MSAMSKGRKTHGGADKQTKLNQMKNMGHIQLKRDVLKRIEHLSPVEEIAVGTEIYRRQ